jgi:acyl dehydratase
MAEDLGRHGTVRTLHYRFASMVFAGETVVVETTPQEDGSFAQVVRVGDRVCVTGGGTVDA